MDTRVKHEYDNKVGVILGHTFFIVILGLVPRIHLKPLDTRDKPEYDGAARKTILSPYFSRGKGAVCFANCAFAQIVK